MDPIQFYKCLSDETRLKCLLLLLAEGELCVCELTHALDEIQPKVSRHLAQLRNCNLLDDDRRGQWVFYRLSSALPQWAREVLSATARANNELYQICALRLKAMGGRPERATRYC